MSWTRRALQTATVLGAIGLGLRLGSVAELEPAGEAERASDHSPAPTSLHPPTWAGEVARSIPHSRWRRARAATTQFEPVVVVSGRLPSLRPPEDTVRDDAWAIPMEHAMIPAVTADLRELFPDAQVETVHCMSTTCRIDISTPSTIADDVFAFVQRTVALGPLVKPRFVPVAGDGTSRLSFVVFLEEVGDAEGWRAWRDGENEMARDRVERIKTAIRERRMSGATP